MPTTRRKSTSRKGKSTGRKSRWSPEQIEEWRRRDAKIMDDSTGYLEDADSVRQFARDAAAGRVSARILGYSLRNQMLLENQAEALGFTLTDVASAREWRERGRRVKPEWYGQNLRLVAPKGKQKKDADPADEPERDDQDDDANDKADEPADDEAGDQDGEKKAPKTKFRTVAVFDVFQTEPIPVEESKECALCLAEAGEPCNPGCTCGACVDYEPTDDAADVVWNNLVEQIGKAEYAYDWPATAANLNGARVRVDHDARTVYAAMRATADDPEAVADLAAALAEIIARADRAAETRRAERRAARAALTAA
jgi:hypothetical protein